MTENNELSEREIEILKLVATGASNKEIAYKLSISPNTVKVHLKNIFAKIEVVSRTEAAMYAVKRGWVGEVGDRILQGVELTEEQREGKSNGRYDRIRLIIGISSIVVLIVILIIFFYNISNQGNNKLSGNAPIPTQNVVSWEFVSKLAEPRKSAAYIADGDQIYIIGGETMNGVTGKVEIYNASTQQVTTIAEKHIPVSETCAVILGGKIYIGGGKQVDGSISNVLEMYDTSAMKWEIVGDIPKPLTGYSCISFEGKMYYLGGWDGQQVRSEIWSYSPLDQTWEIVGKLNQPRAYFGVTVLNNNAYIIGGWDGAKGIDSIEQFNFTGKKTLKVSEIGLDRGRYYLTTISILDKLMIIGGKDGTQGVANSIEINPKSKIVREISNPEDKEWYAMSAINYGEYIYGFGGELGEKLNDNLYRLRVLYTVVLPVIQ